MKNVCILFSGGSYGTFLEWCLNYFTDINFSTELPFTSNGNSHKFVGHHIDDINGCKKYVESNLDYPFVRFHPKQSKDDRLFDSLQYSSNNFNNVIYLHCTDQSIVWNINNKLEKTWDGGWIEYNRSVFSNNLKNWGLDKSLDNIPTWELREFLSFFLYEQHVSETELNNTELFKSNFPNALIISIDTLRDSFEEVITDIINRLNLPIVRNNFSEIYQEWIRLQFHCNKDKLVGSIVNATINDIDMSWPRLTLVDEAMIQYYLRIKGYEIKCYNLNEFPTNTKLLKELLYEST